jgi:hypothetical protein
VLQRVAGPDPELALTAAPHVPAPEAQPKVARDRAPVLVATSQACPHRHRHHNHHINFIVCRNEIVEWQEGAITTCVRSEQPLQRAPPSGVSAAGGVPGSLFHCLHTRHLKKPRTNRCISSGSACRICARVVSDNCLAASK